MGTSRNTRRCFLLTTFYLRPHRPRAFRYKICSGEKRSCAQDRDVMSTAVDAHSTSAIHFEHERADEPLRVAIVSSPRSGNSWIRSTLAGALQAQEIAVHNYLDAPADIPKRCILQLHWYREPNFQRWLLSRDFKIVTIARHPLDVLVSALKFIRYEPETSRWLEGNTGLPGGLIASAPCSEEFLAYATSFEAENLLSISYQWWHDEHVLKVRYEDAILDPVGVLGNLIETCGGEPGAVLPWLDRVSLEKMRALPNRHGWQAKPGLWKQLIPPLDALRIFRRHRTIFRKMGYSVIPHILSRRKALYNWERL
jgi:hypothetical protein